MSKGKGEIYIEVEKVADRKVPVWWINITQPAPSGLPPLTTMLPGDFKLRAANDAAQRLAISYATSGYKVKLTTPTKHGPYLRYFNPQ